MGNNWLSSLGVQFYLSFESLSTINYILLNSVVLK